MYRYQPKSLTGSWISFGPQITLKSMLRLTPLWLASLGVVCAIPAHAGERSADNIAIMMSSNVIWDGINGETEAKAINGAIIEYTVAVAGPSQSSTAAASFAINDDIPDQMTLFVGDIARSGSGPIEFIENDSGLRFQFAGLSSPDDSVEFSSNGGQTFDYTPAPDSEGFDKNVTHVRIAPSGMLMPVDGDYPRFSIQYRMKIN